MSTAQDNQNGQDQSKKVTFKFCRECSNMLYPSEDRENNQLVFACRTCLYSEPPSSSCVYRNELSTNVGDTAGITQDVGLDPTVGLNLLEFCTVCGKEITCEKCGKPTSAGCWLEVPDENFQTSVSDDEMDIEYLSDPLSDEDEDECLQIQEMVNNLNLLPRANGIDHPQSTDQQPKILASQSQQLSSPQIQSQHT